MNPGPHCRYVTRELFIKGTEPTQTCLFHQEEDLFHQLPTAYAGWVYEKDRRGLAGNYRLRGFSRNLEEVFQEDPVGEALMSDLIGIRVRNETDQEISPHPVISRHGSPKDHYSIGVEMVEEEEASSADGPVSIVYPLPHDRFVMEKNRRGQIVRLEVLSPKPMAYVDWFIDGLHYARVGPPYHTYWNLERGRHDITAVTPYKKGDSVQIIAE